MPVSLKIFFFALCWMNVSWGADFHSARTAGLSGAGHAGPIQNDAIYLNPSFTSFLPTYSFSAHYMHFAGDDIETNHGKMKYFGRNLNASVQDGRSPMFQAGIGYTIKEDKRVLNIGASKAAVDRLGIGIGMKALFDSPAGNAKDLIFSTSFLLDENIQSALVIDNIIESDTAVDNNMHREIILAAKLNINKILLLYADPHFVPGLAETEGGKFGYELGAELKVMSDFFVRAGIFYNSMVPFQSARGEGWSLGAGWVGPRLSLDYGMQVVNKSVQGLPQANAHHFGASLFF